MSVTAMSAKAVTTIACEYSRLSFASATTCETRRKTSAIRGQKFHSDDVNLPALTLQIKIARDTKMSRTKRFLLLVKLPHSVTQWTSSTADKTFLINFAFERISPPFRCKFRLQRKVDKCHVPSLDALQNFWILLWNPQK